jgi:hypothetical protein
MRKRGLAVPALTKLCNCSALFWFIILVQHLCSN